MDIVRFINRVLGFITIYGCLLVIASIRAGYPVKLEKTQAKRFRGVMHFIIAGVVVYFLRNDFNGKAGEWYRTLHIVTEFLYHFIAIYLMDCMAYFGVCRAGNREQKQKSVYFMAVLVCSAFAFLLLIGNGFTGILYRIDENNLLVLGPWARFSNLYPLVIIVMNGAYTLCHINNMDGKKIIHAIIDCVVAGVGIVQEINHDEISLSHFIVFFIAVHFFLDITMEESFLAKEKEIEQLKLQEEMNALHMKLLASQIRPHFLYNSLNTIYYLCEEDPKLAQNAIQHFSNYLRKNLESITKEDLIPLSEEMEHVQNYLYLEKLRFEDRLQIETDIRTTNLLVPPLSVQPLVENAVKHGICKKKEGGTIRIEAEELKDRFEIRVRDNGVGFDVSDTSLLWEPHFGIKNVRGRMQNIVGGELLLESNSETGTTAILRIPKKPTQIPSLV